MQECNLPRNSRLRLIETVRGLGRAEEWRVRFRVLQQWVCELLIKNQQLRESLASATDRRNEGNS